VLEGYFDLIRVREAGILEAVACCGTALTADHCAAFARAVGTSQVVARRGRFEVLLATDADDAGRAAAERGAQAVLRAGLRARIATFSGGKDPDELLRDGGDAARLVFETCLTTARTPILNYLDVASVHAKAWGNDLESLVGLLRNLRRRGVGASPALLQEDVATVATRLGVDGGFAVHPAQVLSMMPQEDAALEALGRDWALGASAQALFRGGVA